MKVLVAAASALLAVSGLHGECVVVEPESHSSTHDARLVITLDGKPAEHLPLEITISGGGRESSFQRTTDRHGAINLKKLSSGANYVTISTASGSKSKASATVRLDVTDRVSISSLISLALTHEPTPAQYEMATVNMSPPIQFTSATFTGRIVDQGGAEISGARIAVYRRLSGGTSKPMTFRSDDQGNFSGVLESGEYTVVVMAPAFKLRSVGVEIQQGVPKRLMSIELTVGAC